MGDKSILDYLCGKDYKIALMTTFNFEIDFFERFILNQLYDNNIRKISLFVDAKELSKSIMKVESSYIGKRYFVTPIEMNSSFHPKVFLLLGDKKARLIVGSANLTRSGLKSNNEIFNVFDYDDKHQQNLALINSAMKFFLQLHSINETEKDLFEEISYIGYLDKEAINNESFFLNNIETSILEQLKKLITDKIKSIDIAVPYYDNELLALKEIKNRYPDAIINLYIQNKMSTFNVRYNKAENIVSEDSIKPFSKCECNDSNNLYHGKVIRFNTDNKSYILYGSANCTLSALVNSYNKSGNIECDVLEVGEINDFNYFFDNFIIEYPEILENQTIVYEQQPDNNFTFKCIEENTILEVVINYKSKVEDIEIILNEEKLKYRYEDNKLIIMLPLEIMSSIDNLFDIRILFDGKEELIRCWYNNMQALTSFREVSNERKVTNVRIDDDGSIFMDDEILIMNAMYDPEEIKLGRMQLKKKQIEDEEPDETEEDTFKIDDDIPDDYIRKYKEYEHVTNCVRKLANHYFTVLRRASSEESSKSFSGGREHNSQQTSDNNEDVKRIRRATEPEKRFERLVKSKITDLLNPDKYEKKSYNEYKDLVGFFFQIFDKYKYQEKIEDIFLDSYVIDTKFKLLEVLLSKTDDNPETNKEDNILMTLMVIMETDYINMLQEQADYKVEFKNKELLKQMECLYHIRNDFKGYLSIIIDLINRRTIEIAKELKSRKNEELVLSSKDVYLIRDIIPENHAINVIERLYGYKTNTELLEVIKRYYGSESSIDFNDTTINVICNLDNVGKHLSIENNEPFIQMLKEIKNYSKNINKIDEIKAIINISTEIGLTKIEYSFNFNTQRYEGLQYYANGSKVPRNRQLRI